jgi:predicted ATP-binding protein involved in virulence
VSSSKQWCVQALELQNYRCFEHLRLRFDDDLTVLIGDNGAGKTAVLGGLAVLLSTIVRELDGAGRGFNLDDVRVVPRDLDSRAAVASMEPRYPVVGTLRARLDGETIEWSRSRLRRQGRTSWARNAAADHAADLRKRASRSQDVDPILPIIGVYGVERLMRDRKSSGEIGASRFGAYAAALDSQSDMRRLSVLLQDLTVTVGSAEALGDPSADAAKMQIKAIDLACTRALASTGWGRPRWTRAGVILMHAEHGTLPLAQLSAGIRITAGLVIDLASRAARANPSLGAAGLLGRVPGIVVVDEVDLHLHPSWQKHIIQDLQHAFPRVQFIVTTHSPQVLSTVPAHQIRVIDGSSVRPVHHARGLRSDIVLDTVMDTSPEPITEGRERLELYMAAVYRGEGRSEAAAAMRAQIEAEMGGIETVPELADADAYMLVTADEQ